MHLWQTIPCTDLKSKLKFRQGFDKMRQRKETGLSDIQGCIFEARRRRLKEMRREVGIVGEETKVWMEMSKWRLLVEPNFKTNLEMGIKKNLINHRWADTIGRVENCTLLPPAS